MKIYKLIFISGLALLTLASCEDSLDPKIDGNYGDEWTWGNPDKAEGVLINAYANIAGQVDSYDNNFLDAATDNAVTNDLSSSVYKLGAAAISATGNPIGNWSNCYTQLRNVNLFLKYGLDESIIYYLGNEEFDAIKRSRLKGEAYFLRAWWSMELLRMYGGVAEDGEALGYPIVTENFDDYTNNITSDVRRNTYEECVMQIMNDCDSAILYLPASFGSTPEDVYGAVGRATSKAAHALKSRTALYAASKAYQPEGSYAASGMDEQSKWERAALTANEAINSGNLGGFTALTASMLSGGALGITPNEYLFRKYHNNNSLETRNFPPAYNGNGATNPSQNLVDAFPASNGFPITDVRSGYDPQNPYVNRDKRLALNVLANGDALEASGRALEMFFDMDNNKPGLDAEQSDNKATRTGYYLRKWLSGTPEMLKVGEKKNAEHMHVLLRVAEVYYNFVEASNEAAGPTGIVPGCSVSALEMLRTMRNKSIGVSNDIYLDEVAAAGKDEFRTLIQNERRLEFAFENHRYFDMRRWMLPLNESIKGAKIEKEGDVLTFYGTDPVGESVVVEERPFLSERYYYAPIPYDELVKSPKMKNNKGW